MTVDDYINQHSPDHQRILRWVRQIILLSDSNIREKISWNVPFYTYRRVHLCYLNVVRSEPMAVDLAFTSGHELPDEANLLESRGRKTIKSLIIRNGADPHEVFVRTYMQEALLLIDNRHL